MAEQKQDDQRELTFSSYVRIRDVALKTCRRRWTIERSGERGSGISVLAARHDDDGDDDDVLVQFFWPPCFSAPVLEPFFRCRCLGAFFLAPLFGCYFWEPFFSSFFLRRSFCTDFWCRCFGADILVLLFSRHFLFGTIVLVALFSFYYFTAVVLEALFFGAVVRVPLFWCRCIFSHLLIPSAANRMVLQKYERNKVKDRPKPEKTRQEKIILLRIGFLIFSVLINDQLLYFENVHWTTTIFIKEKRTHTHTNTHTHTHTNIYIYIYIYIYI